jgi:phosphotransferase system IIB component
MIKCFIPFYHSLSFFEPDSKTNMIRTLCASRLTLKLVDTDPIFDTLKKYLNDISCILISQDLESIMGTCSKSIPVYINKHANNGFLCIMLKPDSEILSGTFKLSDKLQLIIIGHLSSKYYSHIGFNEIKNSD